MANGLLDSILGGAKSIGSNLLNIPSSIGQRYQAGTMFGGNSLLGDLLGEDARKKAQSEAIMQMGLSLLGQGPSRTPVSFGQSLAQSLSQAQQAYKGDLSSQLSDASSIMALQKAKRDVEFGDLDTQIKLAKEERDKAEALRKQQEFESKQETEAREEADRLKREERKASQAVSSGIAALDAIDKSLGIIETSPTATGFSGQILRNIERSPAGALDSYYETIRANTGFEQLQTLRDNSPTGGALGPVSDKENSLLQSTRANLKTGLPAEVQVENLNKLKTHIAGIVYGAVDSEGNVVKLDTPEAVSALYEGRLKINYPSEDQVSQFGAIEFGRDSSGNIIRK